MIQSFVSFLLKQGTRENYFLTTFIFYERKELRSKGRRETCNRSLRYLQVNKSQPETAPVDSFHFLKKRAEIKRSSSLLYLHSIASRDLWPAVFHHELIYLQVIAKSMSCHGYKIQVCTLQRHTQTGIKLHRPASSHVRRPHWNRCTVVHLCLCPDFLTMIHVAATHTFLTLQRHTGMISYSFSYSYSGKQKRRKTRKWQVIRTDRWRFTKSSLRNLFRNRLHWCPMLPVIRRKTTRKMCTLFRVEESYTTSETHRMWRSLHFLDQCRFSALFAPWKPFFRKGKKIPEPFPEPFTTALNGTLPKKIIPAFPIAFALGMDM